MSLSEFLLFYARKGLMKPLRKSAFRKFCRRNRGVADIVKVKEGFLVKTVIGDAVDNSIYVYRHYEEATTRVIKALGKQCECFIDVGCNIGYYSCLYKTQNPGGKLVCVDPNPEMIERTKENLRLNNVNDATCLPIAAGPERCTMTLNIPQDRHSLSSLAYVPRRSDNVVIKEIQVQVEPLKDVIDRHNVKSILLKIDAEGFESQVFTGLSRESVKNVDYIIFELSPQNLERAKSKMSSLFSFDWMDKFDILLITDKGTLVGESAQSLIANNTTANILLASQRLSKTAIEMLNSACV